MRKEIKSQLDSLMDSYDKKVSDKKTRQEKIQSAEEEFAAEFVSLRAQIILPVMEEIRAHLQSRGHKVRIAEQDASVDHDGKTSPARITMEFLPVGVERRLSTDSVPAVSFMASKSKKQILVHECTMLPGRGGQAGKRGEYEIKDIDAEIVEREIIGVLKEVFGT
jgi:hypothetical protein